MIHGRSSELQVCGHRSLRPTDPPRCLTREGLRFPGHSRGERVFSPALREVCVPRGRARKCTGSARGGARAEVPGEAYAEVQVEASARGSRTQSEARHAAAISLPPGREGSFSGQLSLLAENPQRELSWDCAVCLGV